MIVVLITLLIALALLFAACAPQWGAAGKIMHSTQSDHFHSDKFHNPVPTNLSSSTKEMIKASYEYFTGQQQREPMQQLPSMLAAPKTGNSGLKVTWLGHSTCLIEIDGITILTDPMFSDRASPFSFMGPKRFDRTTTIQLNELPDIDAVLISHDHYDHLDYLSIQALKEKTHFFYVPLGVGGHLQRWGVSKQQIVELDWWQQVQHGAVNFIATPARHFSGRGLVRNKTLWSSWVIKGNEQRLFFGGDSGYFDGFKQIGDQYGPFDVTLLESGAYNTAWKDIHMMPEQTVQAHCDLQGKLLLPIHWAQFNLSLHSWTEPIERLLAAAKSHNIQVATPMLGQTVQLQHPVPQLCWWELE